MEHALDRQIEGQMKGADPGQAAGGIGQAVIGAEPRDEFLLLRSAAQIVVVAHQLEIGVVGVRAGGAEKHLRQMPGPGFFAEQGQDPVGEPDDRLVRIGRKGVVVAEIGHRLRRRLTQFGAAIADIDAPQPGAAIDQIVPAAVLEPHPRAAGDDRRPVFQMIGDRGRRMEQALPVHLLERVVLRVRRHRSWLLALRARAPSRFRPSAAARGDRAGRRVRAGCSAPTNANTRSCRRLRAAPRGRARSRSR